MSQGFQDATPEPPSSRTRRELARVRADLRVVLSYRDGEKLPARVVDVSVGGMNLRADRVPEYGEAITVIVRLRETEDWHLIPAAVRWFSQGGFGVAFENLSAGQQRALRIFVEQSAA
ncbi:MAG TPA: PilZ domain-containing protein [Polyangiaceae bacterium]|nr:PilZ domain-containing protein [Polyangiaceae bacterium]